jgi:IS605 OrfB family transposase
VIVTRVVKLLPTPQEASALEATLRACNQACGLISQAAHAGSVFDRNRLQKLVYRRVREERGLGAQAAVRCVKKTVNAYAALHAQAKAGLLGWEGSTRRMRVLGRRIVFGPLSAQPFDDRMLSWRHDARTISIWAVSGRLKDVAFTGEPGQLKEIAEYRRGESDLVFRDGMWFLCANVEIPEAARNQDPVEFLGVDLGIVNIATTSDGNVAAGRGLNRHRKRQQDLRAKLQAKGTKSAKRLLKKRRRKEQRHATDVNHCISKRIVAEAQRTGRGIALEDLKGIRERARFRRPQRATLHSWAFHQLGRFVVYKARRAAVPVVHVNPAYTSQECAECHHIDRRNRPSQAMFACRSCGVVAHADRNASCVIAQRGENLWTAGRESRVPAPTPQPA